MTKAWLTPSLADLSSAADCRTLQIPSALWLYINGALEPLTREYNWEQFGDATVEDTVAFFIDWIDQYSNSECGGGVNWIYPAVTIIDANEGDGVSSWNIARNQFPANATAIVTGVTVTTTEVGYIEHYGPSVGRINYGVMRRNFGQAGDLFQLITAVSDLGVIYRIVNGLASWTLKVDYVGWL